MAHKPLTERAVLQSWLIPIRRTRSLVKRQLQADIEDHLTDQAKSRGADYEAAIATFRWETKKRLGLKALYPEKGLYARLADYTSYTPSEVRAMVLPEWCGADEARVLDKGGTGGGGEEEPTGGKGRAA